MNSRHNSNTALKKINKSLEGSSVYEILNWVASNYETEKIGFGTGFGSSGGVLLDYIVQVNNRIPVFYIDTDVLFPETYELKSKLENRYNIKFIKYHSEISMDDQDYLMGNRLWETNPDKCCNIRKVEPLKNALSNFDVWITGIRRDQSVTRANTQIVEWEPRFNILKINPIVYWTKDRVWTYIRTHNIPYNNLYDSGFGSIGCFHCTSPLNHEETERDGRWRGLGKTECGLHLVEKNDTTLVAGTAEK